MVTTRPPKTIVKPTALGPVANTDTKLLIYGLFQKGRVLAQDGVGVSRSPGLVEELVCQWGRGGTALRRASPWFGSPCLQLRLDRVPELRSNDRWMLALVDTPLVPDAAGVERIGQQAVEVSATERQPARSGSIRGEALLGTQSQTVRLGLHLPERFVLSVQRIDPDRFGLSLVDAQRAPVLLIAERYAAAHP